MTVKVVNTLNGYNCYYDGVEKMNYVVSQHGTSCECGVCETVRFLLQHEKYDLTLVPVYSFELLTMSGETYTFDSSIGTHIFLLNKQGKTIDVIRIEYKGPQV